jgi:glycosyltransferase involved in cell wall biosynthesis
MRLGINVVRLTRPFTGVGRYIECLLREWSHGDLPFGEIVLYAPAPIDSGKVAFPVGAYRLEVSGPHVPDPLWEWWTLRGRRRAIDVLFCPSYTLPLGYRGPSAVTYFGPSTNPPGTYEWWRSRAYERLHRYSARRAGRVLTASSGAHRRVVEVYGVPEENVDVIPLAASAEFTPVRDAAVLASVRRQYLGDAAPYVLFVGKLSGRHSIPELIDAFARVRNRHRLPHRLLLVGPDTLGLDVPGLVRRRGLDGVVVHVPDMGYRDLPAAYSGATAFVFPATEAEGFGIPILEAMACGTPVVSTRLGSVPEVAGDAALLAPSSAARHLEDALARVLLDAGLRSDLARRGRERASLFSWRRTAERTMEALRRVATRSS